eukprot:3941537-Rhodomonas_salina.1
MPWPDVTRFVRSQTGRSNGATDIAAGRRCAQRPRSSTATASRGTLSKATSRTPTPDLTPALHRRARSQPSERLDPPSVQWLTRSQMPSCSRQPSSGTAAEGVRVATESGDLFKVFESVDSIRGATVWLFPVKLCAVFPDLSCGKHLWWWCARKDMDGADGRVRERLAARGRGERGWGGELGGQAAPDAKREPELRVQHDCQRRRGLWSQRHLRLTCIVTVGPSLPRPSGHGAQADATRDCGRRRPRGTPGRCPRLPNSLAAEAR